MNRALGHVEVMGPNGSTVRETFTCCHCNGIKAVPAPGEPMGYCQRCHARECVPCATRLEGRCTPFEKRLEAYERRQRMLVAITG